MNKYFKSNYKKYNHDTIYGSRVPNANALFARTGRMAFFFYLHTFCSYMKDDVYAAKGYLPTHSNPSPYALKRWTEC